MANGYLDKLKNLVHELQLQGINASLCKKPAVQNSK